MKKYFCLCMLSITFSVLHAQNSGPNILVRHDTTMLMEGDCEWVIKSMAKNDPALNQEVGKSLSGFLLDAIEKGKLKAVDPSSNEVIPANKIYTWHLAADSMMTADASGNAKIVAVQRKHSSDKIDKIRICHDWYLDIATGKIQSVIKWIELREQVYTGTGLFIGYGVLCRIYY